MHISPKDDFTNKDIKLGRVTLRRVNSSNVKTRTILHIQKQT